MSIARSLFIAGGLGLTLSACVAINGTERACRLEGYPVVPAGAQGVVHVSATSGSATGDGSIDRPFASIQQGIDAAPEGGAVLVMAGSYRENLRIAKRVMVVGGVEGCGANEARIILQATDPRAVEVTGASGVVLRGLRIEGALGAGVAVAGGEVRLEGSAIDEVEAQGEEGFGVLATDDASIILQNNAISGTALGGVVVRNAKGIILQSEIRDGKGRGGIILQHASGPVTIEKTIVAQNERAGIAVLSSKAIILQSEVMDTIGEGGKARADGIVVAEMVESGLSLGAAEATIQESTIGGNDRAGVVFSGNTRGIILQNNIVGNGDNTAFGAGIWLQTKAGGADGIEIAGNAISGNHFMGIGVTSGSRAIILQKNTISGTLGDAWTNESGQSVELGDGIAAFNGAFVRIEGDEIQRNARSGIFLDAASPQSVVHNNVLLENGIILQNMPEMDLSTNEISDATHSATLATVQAPKEDMKLF